MSLRTRLIVFVLLFGSAVLTNIFALVYLARSISNSLDAIENIRQRQLVAVQMNAHLRDAEAALYRYHIAKSHHSFIVGWTGLRDLLIIVKYP